MQNLSDRLAAAVGDRYRIEHEIGAGGMATVFLAEDLKHHRKVAVKVLRHDLAPVLGPERFLREIAIVARLHHPHILSLHDSGQAEGLLYYVMPFVEGESLREKLARDGALPIPEVVRILRELADALAYAHQHGVVHRDLKPANVMLSGRHALVMDFGVAKAMSAAVGDFGETTAGLAVGTPAYMAPEQAAADPRLDFRVDLYALGLLGFEMLAGRPPFTNRTPRELVAAQAIEHPPELATLRGEVPPFLKSLIMKCLEKRPDDRPKDAAEIHALLEAIGTPGSGSRAVPAGWARPRRGPRVGLRRIGMAMGVIALGITVPMLVTRVRARRAPSPDASVVMVVPFRVSGADRSLAYLREGIPELLAAKLTGGGGLRAADPSAVLSAWKREGGGPDTDPSRARTLSLAGTLGAGRILEGSVVGSRNRITLAASLSNVPWGAAEAQASVEGSEDSLPVLVDRLVVQLLVAAGAAMARGSELTSSLPALKAYLDGVAAYRAGRYLEAGIALDRALDIDSTFALAAMVQVEAAEWDHSVPRADRAMRLLGASLEQLGPRDRAVVAAAQGPHFPGYSTPREKVDAAEAAVQLAPDHPDVWYHLGDSYFHSGAILGYPDAMARALNAFERAMALAPGFVGPQAHVVEILALRRDTAALRPYRALIARSEVSGRGYLLWRIAAAVGDSAERAQRRERFDSLSNGDLERVVIHVITDGLDPRDAAAAVEVARRRASNRWEEASALWPAAALAINRGRPREADRLLDEIGGIEPDDNKQRVLIQRYRIMNALYAEGDETVGRNTVAALDLAKVDHEACLTGLWRLGHGDTSGVGGTIAAARRNDPRCALAQEMLLATTFRRPDAAALRARLDSVLSAGAEGLSFYLLPVVVRGHLMAGDTAAALAALPRRLYAQTGPPHDYIAQTGLEGRLAEAQGDRRRAREAYRIYLALRDDPEPALVPRRDSVRARLRALERMGEITP